MHEPYVWIAYIWSYGLFDTENSRFCYLIVPTQLT